VDAITLTPMADALSTLQLLLAEHNLDGYLITDFRGSSLTLPRVLPAQAGARRWTTRRVGLLITATGKPTLLASAIDEGQFPPAAYPQLDIQVFISWQQWQAHLTAFAKRCPKLAMDYSPDCQLPVVSTADAGTVEFVRAAGAQIVSSADLVQQALATWSAEAIAGHERASKLVDGIKDEAFATVRDALAAGRTICEHDVAEHIVRRFGECGLETRDCPVVACNEHAADPHYEPSAAHRSEIRRGDLILLDLWARLPGEEHIFSDISWMAMAGVPSARQSEIFASVCAARDASLAAAQSAWQAKRGVRGYELDDAARHLLIARGLEGGIKHRTGHSLSPGPLVHGVGMNLDNLETHDYRVMLPGTGFTIEPGIYLPNERIGVRSEINVFVDPVRGPIVTSGVQKELVRV